MGSSPSPGPPVEYFEEEVRYVRTEAPVSVAPRKEVAQPSEEPVAQVEPPAVAPGESSGGAHAPMAGGNPPPLEGGDGWPADVPEGYSFTHPYLSSQPGPLAMPSSTSTVATSGGASESFEAVESPEVVAAALAPVLEWGGG